MNSVDLVRRATLLLPGAISLIVVLAPAQGYELAKDLAASVFFFIFAASFLTHSDWLHTTSLLGSAMLLGLTATQSGLLVSFAVVVSLLMMLDVAEIVKSLFGLTRARVDLQDRGTTSAYLGIVEKQAVRSFGIGFVTFLISLAILSTPIPVLAFGNPVSGSGLLALSTLLLILLAAARVRIVDSSGLGFR